MLYKIKNALLKNTKNIQKTKNLYNFRFLENAKNANKMLIKC
mgnify:CR=1 FL=1|jgi:hypothetical protein